MGLSFHVINQPYMLASKDLENIQMMMTLDGNEIPPLDWIIVADVDEFYTFKQPALAEVLAEMEADGATYALGAMINHLSEPGSIGGLQVCFESFVLLLAGSWRK